MNRFRFLIYSIALALLGYGIWAWMNDGQKIHTAVSRVGFSGLFFLCILSLANYFLRYIRCFFMLRQLGDRPPFMDGLVCYFAGFALTTTPGKTGEVVRCLYFRSRHGVDNAHSFAVLLLDRLTDLLAALVLSLGALHYFENLRWVAWIAISLVVFVMLAVLQPILLLRACSWFADRGPGFLRPFFAAAPVFFERCALLMEPGILLAGVTVGLLSWSAEAYGFGWLAHSLGSQAELAVLMGIFCLAMIAGVAMPGGLGGTEAAMAVSLVSVGMEPADAFVVTVLCRIATLWFSVLLGLLSMLWLEHKSFPVTANVMDSK